MIGSAGGGSVSGSGTVGRISKFVGASIIGDSIISESGSAIVVSGNITGTQIIKSGGLSSQFLKADGSIDSNSYLTSAVTNVSGSNGSGFLFTVLNPTTTPVISLTTSLTQGLIPYIGLSGALGGGQLFYDATNAYLGVNTMVPISVVDFRVNDSSTNQITFIGGRTATIINTNNTNNNLTVLNAVFGYN